MRRPAWGRKAVWRFRDGCPRNRTVARITAAAARVGSPSVLCQMVSRSAFRMLMSRPASCPTGRPAGRIITDSMGRRGRNGRSTIGRWASSRAGMGSTWPVQHLRHQAAACCRVLSHVQKPRLRGCLAKGRLDRLLEDAGSARDQGLGHEILHRHEWGLRQRVPDRQRTDRVDRQERLAVDADIAGAWPPDPEVALAGRHPGPDRVRRWDVERDTRARVFHAEAADRTRQQARCQRRLARHLQRSRPSSLI